MITENLSVIVEFDKGDERRIENAILVIREIGDALSKAGGHTSDIEGSLEDAAARLQGILDRTLW